MRKRPAKERAERIRQLASVGWTAEQIAEKFGLARSTVYSYASLFGIDLPKAANHYHARRQQTRADAVAYTRANPGETRSSIAARFGISPVTVHRALKAAGVPTMRQYDADGKLIDQAAPKA